MLAGGLDGKVQCLVRVLCVGYERLCGCIPANLAEYSQAVDITGHNSVCVELTVFTSANVTVMVQCSNDATNWSDTSRTTTGAGSIYKFCPHSVFGQIASKWIRLKLTTNATPAIVCGGLNCANIGA